MAIYHLSFKTASKGKGRSAGAHARYIEREGKYEMSRANEALEYKASGNMPAWASGKELAFWDASDLHERANGRVYSELEVALPREMTPEQRRELVTDFIETELRNQPFTVAIHNKIGLDGGEQPHAHIMFSERQMDGIERSEELYFKRANDKNPALGGTKKNRDWNRREKVDEIRSAWEIAANRALEKAGIEQRIDKRTLKEQGIDRAPEPKMGPERTQMLKNGKSTEISDQVVELRHYRTKERELKQLQEELKKEKARVYQFGTPTQEQGQEQTGRFERVGESQKVSPEEQKRYSRVLDLVFTKVENEKGHTEYRWNRSGRTAFTDEGNRIGFRSSNETSIKAALQLTKQKGWKEIKAKGSEEFKRESWVQGQVLGVKVAGHQVTKADELEVERRREELEKKKAQYRTPGKEKEKSATSKAEPSKGDSPATEWVKASDVLKACEKHIAKDAATYRSANQELSGLDKYPRNLTEEEAIKIAETALTQGRKEKLQTELKRQNREIERAESTYKQFKREKGLRVLLPRNAKEDKRFFKAWCDAATSYNETVDEWSALQREMERPENKKLLDEKTKALLFGHKEQEERRTTLEKQRTELNRKLSPYRNVMEQLKTLGDRSVQVSITKEQGKQINIQKLEEQLRKLEQDQDKQVSKGRGK